MRVWSPEFVFANQPDTFIPTGGSAWVEFLPYEEPLARICLAGRGWKLEPVELDDLISVVDQTEEFAYTTRELGDD
jgi:hypothetical protein